MHEILVHTHSGNRWLVLAAAVFAIFRYATGMMGNRPFEKLDNIAGAAFVGTVHLQLLLGFILYYSFWQNITGSMADIMHDPIGRFFAVEHIFGMILGGIFAQLGRTLSKKATDDAAKFKKGLIWFSLSIFIILASIPWPFIAKFAGRSYF